MATDPAGPGRGDRGADRVGGVDRVGGADRRTDETKPAYKTTEFIAYVVMLAGVFIAAALVGEDNNKGDDVTAEAAWLYAVILTLGYMLSRGLAKAGARHRFWDDGGR